MDIGTLNRRIEVLELIENRDEFGGVIGEWITVGIVWASISSSNGKEFFNSQQVNAENTTIITMRFYAGLNELNRIRYNRKLFEIIGVSDENMAHRMTVVTAKEVLGNGI